MNIYYPLLVVHSDDNGANIPLSLSEITNRILIDRQTDQFGDSLQAYAIRALVTSYLIPKVPIFLVFKGVADRCISAMAAIFGATLQSLLQSGASVYWLFRSPCLPPRVGSLLKLFRNILSDEHSSEDIPTIEQIDGVIETQIRFTPQPPTGIVRQVLDEFPVPLQNAKVEITKQFPFSLDYARLQQSQHSLHLIAARISPNQTTGEIKIRPVPSRRALAPAPSTKIVNPYFVDDIFSISRNRALSTRSGSGPKQDEKPQGKVRSDNKNMRALRTVAHRNPDIGKCFKTFLS